MEILIENGIVMTLDEKRRVFKDGAVLIEGDRVTHVGKSGELRKDHKAEVVIDAKNMLVMPGLVDCHVHLSLALIRGCADGMTLMPRLKNIMFPLQGNYTKEDGRASALLCMLEMLKSGTTCFVESMTASRYGFNGIAEALEQIGMRGIISKFVMDMAGYSKDKSIMPPGLIEEREASVNETVQMVKKWNNAAGGRIKVWFGPMMPGGCTSELYIEVSELAKKYKTGITMHLAELKTDVEYVKSKFDMLPIEYARSVDLLGPNVLLVHAVWLSHKEIALLAETQTRVCHCPTSNAKLASGVARIPEMLNAGVTVGLGCDSGTANNCYDMFREMKLTSILHPINTFDPSIMPPETVIEMASIYGAKACGWDNEIGSIEQGKKADIVLVDLRKPHLFPLHNPISQIVYAANGSDVDTVIVDGKILMQNRVVKTVDERQILEEAQSRGISVVKRVGVKVKPKWPIY